MVQQSFQLEENLKDSCFQKIELVREIQKLCTLGNIVREILLTGSTGNYLRRQMILW